MAATRRPPLFVVACSSVALLALPAPGWAQETPPTPAPPTGEEAPRGEGEGPERGRYRGPDGDFAGRAVEFLTRELDLDKGQREQVQAILDDVMQQMFSRMGDMFRGGFNMDEDARAKARQAFEDVRLEVAKRITEVLTPAQRREFEVLVEQFDRRAQSFEQSRRAWEEPSELFNPAPPSKRLLLAKAERSLFLGPDETAVILPYVERVLDARQALYEGRKVRRKDLLNAATAGASGEEIAERMATVRAAEQFQSLELVASQQALRDLLTIEQEARLVVMGILD